MRSDPDYYRYNEMDFRTLKAFAEERISAERTLVFLNNIRGFELEEADLIPLFKKLEQQRYGWRI